MNFDNHLFRPSMLGDLMSNAQGKKDTKSLSELGETAKGKLLEIFIEKVYGRTKDVTNKYMEKGTMQEEESMTLYSRVTGEIFFKNKETLRNEYFVGTPDIIHADYILDLKTSWDIHTFFKTKLNPINKNYICQLNAYMDLTNKDSAKLVYTLVNTPENLIEDEKKKARWRLSVIDEDNDPAYIAAVHEIEKNSRFDDIPMEKRYITFELQRDQELIDSMKARVQIWREILNMLPK